MQKYVTRLWGKITIFAVKSELFARPYVNISKIIQIDKTYQKLQHVRTGVGQE